MQKGQLLRVKDDHKFHAGRVGCFEFMGGVEQDIIVMSDPNKPKEPQHLFAVGQNDVEVVL